MSNLPPIQITEPEIFIIESLKLEEEKEEYKEGKFLYNYLKLSGKHPIYYYIRSKRELEELSNKFRESGFRYLYISCHGDSTSIHTTLDAITFEDFASIFAQKLRNRRLFVSGCCVGQENFAKHLFEKNEGMFSLTAPDKDVTFHQMVPFWLAFFYTMDSIDTQSMKCRTLWQYLQLCSNMFNVNMIHFYKYQNASKKREFKCKDVISEQAMNKILGLKNMELDT